MRLGNACFASAPDSRAPVADLTLGFSRIRRFACGCNVIAELSSITPTNAAMNQGHGVGGVLACASWRRCRAPSTSSAGQQHQHLAQFDERGGIQGTCRDREQRATDLRQFAEARADDHAVRRLIEPGQPAGHEGHRIEQQRDRAADRDQRDRGAGIQPRSTNSATVMRKPTSTGGGGAATLNLGSSPPSTNIDSRWRSYRAVVIWSRPGGG